MSIVNNTTKLQLLMDKINALPTMEDLTPELSEQDALILQIAAALQGKALDGESASPSLLLQSKSATPATTQQTIVADDGYDGLRQVVIDAMPEATQAMPIISVGANGLITASATQLAGYVANGTKSATKQLPTQGAVTITPGDSVQTVVNAGTYVTGDIKVAAEEGKMAIGTYSNGSSSALTSFTINTGFVVKHMMFVASVLTNGAPSSFGRYTDGAGMVVASGPYAASAQGSTTSLALNSTANSTTLSWTGCNVWAQELWWIAVG